jgi:hypothetical protein
MNDTHLCPRRSEMGITDSSHPFKVPNSDHWRMRDGHRTCSWCGSLHPDDFMECAEVGKKLTPTDKNYKVYVDNTTKFYFQHLSEAQKTRFVELMNGSLLIFAEPGFFYVLPFFAQRKSAT